MGQWQQIITHDGFTANHFVSISFRFQPVVPSPSVSSYRRTRFHALLNGLRQTRSRRIRSQAQTNAPQRLVFVFNSNHHQLLAFRATPSFAGMFAADICFVHLNKSMQSVAAGTHHGTAQFVQPCPGGMITAKPQKALQSQSADTVLLIGDVPHGAKPLAQRLSGVLKDSPGSDGDLRRAFLALVQASLRRPGFIRIATRALKTLRPTHLIQILATGFLAGKPFFKLRDRFRVVLHGLHTTSCTWGSQLHSPYPKFSRDISIGGSTITHALQQRLEISFTEAEALKRQKGAPRPAGQEEEEPQPLQAGDEIMDSIRSTVEAMTGEQDLGSPKDVTTQRAIQNTLNNLIGEIRRSIQFFQNQSPESPVTKLILGGGTANMLDLPAYLQQELNLPVEVIDPLRRIPVTGPDIDASLLKEQKNLLSVGIGLAMRKVVD